MIQEIVEPKAGYPFTKIMRRSEKLSNLLRNLEVYVNEVVTSNHGTKPLEMSQIVTANFRLAIKANIDHYPCFRQSDSTPDKFCSCLYSHNFVGSLGIEPYPDP